jgi:ribA/ribD-fused uncharacterized protein
MKVIWFYRENDAYGFLSNFALHPITLEGRVWPTSEHYFQAQKFLDETLRESIRNAPSAKSAALLGHDRTKPLRGDWEAVKDEVMYKAVFAKFSQHPNLKEDLLATGDAYLVEHTANDRYWGDGWDGRGKNKLGHILMQVRKDLLHEKQVNGLEWCAKLAKY